MTARLGVEISSTAVRIAAIEGGRKPQLVGWAEEPLPPGAVTDGGVAEPDLVQEALAAAARAARVTRRPLGSPRRVRVAVAGLRAITRQVEMPPMPDGEIEAAARMQALEVVPFPPERTLLKARRLRRADDGEGVSVLLEAAHRDLVEPLVTCVAKAGFVVDSVELSSSALVRSLAGDPTEGPEAIVSIGGELTTLVVHEAGEVRFVRTIAAGGATVTRALAAALDMPVSDAEAMKIRLGSSSAIASTVSAEAVAAARDASAVLLSEIRSSIIYYSSLPGAQEVARVVLTGGGALLAGLADRLQFQMAAPVVLRSCLEGVARVRVAADRVPIAQRGAVAVGLALAPSGHDVPGLLPPEVLADRRRQRVDRAVLAGVGVVLLAAAGGGAARYVQVHRAQQSVQALDASIQVLRHDLPNYHKAQVLEDAAVADEQIAQPLVADEVSWPAVLAELGHFTPPGVATTSLTGATAAPAPPASTASTTAGSGSGTGGTAGGGGTLTATTAGTPTAAQVLGTVNLSLSSANYPGFQAWFDSLASSKYFQIVQYSGLTSNANAVDYTAELNLTGLLHAKAQPRLEGFTP